MRTIILSVMLLIASTLAAIVNAQTSSNAYSFLEIPTSAHAYALGGNGAAIIDDDATLVSQNPALLGPEIEKQLAFSYMYYMQASNFAAARFAMGAGENSAWGIGLRYLNYGKLTGYDHTGIATGEFSPQDMVIEGTYSRDINDRLRGGANFKVIYSNYEQYTAWALAVDLGINYYNEDHDLSFSAVLSNMGGQVKRFDTAYNRLPFNITLAYMQGIANGPFSIAITADNLTRWKLPYYAHEGESDSPELKQSFASNLFRHLIFGLQYSPSDKFYIGLGYNYKTRTDMATYHRNFLSGFSVGLGFKVKAFRLNVAYAMPHKSGSSLMLNLATNLEDLIH